MVFREYRIGTSLMWLSDDTFKTVIASTPLISIDLIVKNEKGEVLLGKRANARAKGDWFVPGGRVRKNETLDDAFVRLVKEELGIENGITRNDAKFLGVFEHFYDDCMSGSDVSTHYIILGYAINLINLDLESRSILTQHELIKWINIKNNMVNGKINSHCFFYFNS